MAFFLFLEGEDSASWVAAITRKCIYTYFKVDIILDIEVYLRDERNFILNEAISLD